MKAIGYIIKAITIVAIIAGITWCLSGVVFPSDIKSEPINNGARVLVCDPKRPTERDCAKMHLGQNGSNASAEDAESYSSENSGARK